jgi:dihydropteroate synthase
VPTGNPAVRLGSRRYDLTRRCLVMGILKGATSALDETLRRAEVLVAEGADILDVGDVNAVEAIVARFDVPVSAATSDAGVLAAACAAGAVVGNDGSGFADPAYLPTAARAGASVVATQSGPVADVAGFLVDRAGRARAAGLEAEKIILDAGLDLGQAAALAGLGYPLLLSAPDAHRVPSLTAVAYGVSHGCRIVRVHEVAGTVRVVRLIERILEAEAESRPSGGEA